MIEIDFGCTKRLVISSFLKYFRSWFRPWLHRHNDVRDPLITGFFFFGSFSFFFFILPSSERRFFNRIPRFRYGSAIAWNLANPPAPPPLSLSFFLPFSHRFHFFNEECTEFLDEDPQNWNLGAERRGEYPQRSSMDPAIETMAPFSSNYSEAADSIWLTKKKGKI